MAISYFFPALSSEESNSLENHGCICAAMSINSETGYVVNEADLETALRVLNLRHNRTDVSGMAGVMRVEFARSNARTGAARSQSCLSNVDSLIALNNVLAQVQKLQAQACLTEPERAERLRLQGEVHSTQSALEAATQRLKSTVAIYDQTAARIESIADIAASLGSEMAALPVDLQGQCSAVNDHLAGLADKLKELAVSCNNDKTAALEDVEQKRVALKSAKQALVDDINKKRVSAEDALVDADTALSEAARVSATQG